MGLGLVAVHHAVLAHIPLQEPEHAQAAVLDIIRDQVWQPCGAHHGVENSILATCSSTAISSCGDHNHRHHWMFFISILIMALK